MTMLTEANRQWSKRPADERMLSLEEQENYVLALQKRSLARVVSNRAIKVQPSASDPIWGLEVAGPSGSAYTPNNWSFSQLCGLADNAPAGDLCAHVICKLPAWTLAVLDKETGQMTTSPKQRWIVEELAAKRWHLVRSFDNEEDAKAFACWLGRKARYRQV